MKYYFQYLKISLRLPFGIIIMLTTGCKKTSLPEIEDNNKHSFSLDWKFTRDSLSGAEAPDFDDSGWRTIDLPHDWSIEDLPGGDSHSQIGPFSRDSPGGTSTGYAIGGTGWYRRSQDAVPQPLSEATRNCMSSIHERRTRLSGSCAVVGIARLTTRTMPPTNPTRLRVLLNFITQDRR